MSKVVRTLVGVALVAASFIPGLQFLLPIGASMLVSTAIDAIAGGPPKTKPQAVEARMQIGEIARRAWFGEAVAGGSLLTAFNHGGQYGTDWETLAIALADHRCEQLLGVYVGDSYVPFTGDGPIAGYNGQLEIYWRPGTADQSIPATLTAKGGFGPNDNCAGICYVVVAYRADKAGAKNPVWPGGRPQFRWHMRGARLYDPRKDSTVPGGSGPHRWTDPSTREWSNNAELCRYNFDRGIFACDRVTQPGDLLIGRGLTAIEAPPERVFSAANLCDEIVALKDGGTEPRYRANGIIAADEEFGAVAEEFAKAMGGIVVQPEGGIAVEPGHAKSPVAYITDDDIVAGTKVTFSDFASEADEAWCNTVIARYTEPSQKWADHAAPVRRNSADLIADGGPREASLSLRLVTSGAQAQRIAEIRRRQGRLHKTGILTLGPRFAELEEGDWIVWTSARRTAGQPVTFRIEGYRQSKDWRMELTLRQINASCYSWAAADQITDGATAETQTPPDGYGVPDPGTWALTGGVVSGADGVALPAIVFTGAVEDAYTAEVRFEYRTYADGRGPEEGWIGAELAAPNVIERRITVAGGVQYQGAVSYRFPGGQPGERLILGPVTSGDTVTPQPGRGAYQVRAAYTPTTTAPIYVPSGSSSSTITIPSHDVQLEDGRRSGVEFGTFPAATITDLSPSTTYGLFWSFTDSRYETEVFPSPIRSADPTFIFYGYQDTSSADGDYPTVPTPPDGYRGTGGRGANPV